MNYEETVKRFCDNYCKYPYNCRDEEDLMTKCEECPICELAEKLETKEQKSKQPDWKNAMLRTFLGGK